MRSPVQRQVWRVKPQGPKQKEGPIADINMTFILPKEFMASVESDDESKIEEGVAELILEPALATFEKTEKEDQQHLKPLFLKGYVNGSPMTRMLVDGGTTVNLMPYAILRKLGKGESDLMKTNLMLKDFEGKTSPARGHFALN